MYIYENPGWPDFFYDANSISPLLEQCHIEQGKLLLKMNLLGLSEKEDKILSTITSDITKSSEIEGLILNKAQVRSSIARRLGIQRNGLISSDRNTDAVVEMMIEATHNYEQPLTEERLFGWHACLFPTGYSGMYKIDVGKYRTNPMQVISGALGQEKVHYEAPAPEKIKTEMNRFLEWINGNPSDTRNSDSLIKSAVAHLWFLTIHPFDDGNGRIARTISDMLLCRSDRTSARFYSMSSQIEADKNSYYEILEHTQKGGLDITEWVGWFLSCALKSINESSSQSDIVMRKYSYLQSIEDIPLNERQRLMISRLLDATWFGVLNTSKWAKIAKCSVDTALRDISDLIKKGILEKESTSGGRSTNYNLVETIRQTTQ